MVNRIMAGWGSVLCLVIFATGAASDGVRDITSQTSTAGQAAPAGAGDPFLDLFGGCLTQAKAGKWPELQDGLAANGILKRLDARYGAECQAKILEACKQQKANDLAMYLAHTVYLGVRENFDEIVKDDFKNFTQNEKLLNAAKSRYEKILSGNIKKKDEALHTGIIRAFAKAQVAMGQVGVEADRAAFQAARDEIIAGIKKVYTYFAEKK